MSFRLFLSILRRRWYAVLLCLLAGVGGAVAYLHERTRIYQSVASVDYQPPTGANGQPLFDLEDPVPAIEGSAVTARSAKALDISASAVSQAETSVTYSSTTGVVRIAARSSRPREAAAIANAVAEAYVANVDAGVRVKIARIEASRSAVLAQINKLQRANPSGASNPASPVGAEIGALTQTVASLTSEMIAIQSDGPSYALIQSSAPIPTAPTGTRSSEVILLAVLAGLLVGIAAALIWEHLDETLLSAADVRDVTELPILAELPTERRVEGGPTSLVLLDRPNSAISDSLRELRTSSWFADSEGARKALLVTSPAPGEGKTLVAASLAVAHAMVGRRVVVVSADLASRRIERLLGGEAVGKGLADLVQESMQRAADERVLATAGSEVSVADARLRSRDATAVASDWPTDGRSVTSCVVPSNVAGVWILPAGAGSYGSELLAGDAMRDVVMELTRHFDLTIIDTRPVMSSPDAAALSPMVGGVVLVISAGRTSACTLDSTLERLEDTRANVLGVVLNRVRRSSSATFHPLRQRRGRLH